MDKTEKNNKNGMLVSICKGALVAILLSLVGILFFAFIIKLFGINDSWIRPINQVIKAISILFGTIFGLKKNSSNGLLKGLLIGLIYTVVAFIVFSILNGKFNFDKTLLTDIIFGGIMGGICGVISANARNKSLAKNA